MKHLLIAAACFFFLNASSFAQSDKEDIDLIQSAYGKDKKSIVSVYMKVATKDSAAFWTLYDDYENKRKAIGRERINLIKKYANSYDALNNATATQLATGFFANDTKTTQMQQLYFNKFATIIGGKNAAKLFQLEAYLQNTVRGYIMDQIPFIGELDKTKKP
jgi:hypothetical protein